MKTSSTSLGVISGLIVLAAADALPPEDVPIPCATICGPIVELSSKCVPSKGNRKRDIIIEGLRTGDEADASQNEDGVDGEMDKRFFTVVPAPTSFPAQLSSVLLNPYGGSGGDDEESSSVRLNGSPFRITPVIVQTPRNTTLIIPTARPPPSLASPSLRPPPPAQVPAVMSSATLVLPPSRPFGAAPTLNPSRSPPSDPAKAPMSMSMVAEPNMSDGADAGQPLDTEARCVCLNRSFDVALVAALCTSCITKNGDSQTGKFFQATFPAICCSWHRSGSVFFPLFFNYAPPSLHFISVVFFFSMPEANRNSFRSTLFCFVDHFKVSMSFWEGGPCFQVHDRLLHLISFCANG